MSRAVSLGLLELNAEGMRDSTVAVLVVDRDESMERLLEDLDSLDLLTALKESKINYACN